MVVLDTDHVSLVSRPDGNGRDRLLERLAALDGDEVVTTILTYEEQTRGWLAYLANPRDVAEEVARYRRLAAHLGYSCGIRMLPFDARAAAEYQRLRSLKLRVGTMDLKIAAVALANAATVLTRNLVDFRRVPGLMVEDWTV